MTVTIEVPNQGALTLLKDMEGLGLIHLQPPAVQNAAPPAPESGGSWRWLRGCCKGQGGSVERFLADCRADKERELAIERRQEEERTQHA